MKRVKEIVCAKDVYRAGYSGNGIKIAILDTGVYLHQGILGKISLFRDYMEYKKNPYDDNGHGTHIAGIICGAWTKNGRYGIQEFQGMAPGAKLAVFKILDKNGTGSTEKALKALDWLILHHKKEQIRILNFSMGYLPNGDPKIQKKLVDKLEQLWEEGVVVVTAAGNNGPRENTVTVPGISRKVITVGSSDDMESNQRGEINCYGGRGPTDCCIVKPEILAPGTDIVSFSNHTDGFVKKSGTSMSVPIVCGALALLLEKRPDLKPVEIKLLLYDSVLPVKEKNISAWGILHVDNLMKML